MLDFELALLRLRLPGQRRLSLQRADTVVELPRALTALTRCRTRDALVGIEQLTNESPVSAPGQHNIAALHMQPPSTVLSSLTPHFNLGNAKNLAMSAYNASSEVLLGAAHYLEGKL